MKIPPGDGADRGSTSTAALPAHAHPRSAYASFEEHIKGSIEPGKLADMVVWSHDIYTASPRELAELKPLTAIVGGNVVHE